MQINQLVAPLTLLFCKSFHPQLFLTCSMKCSFLPLLDKGHFGANSFVPCREVVPISEVKWY